MKIKAIIFLLLFTNLLYSQNANYIKGYFIDNNNNRVDCLIRKKSWEKTPTSFEYKLEESSPQRVITKDNFKELVTDEYKFIVAKINIDKSSDKYEFGTTTSKSLNFIEEILIIKVLFDGEVNLYVLKTENYERFFYGLNSSILPLSYKVYYDNGLKEYRKNNTYKQEILNTLKCEGIVQKDINILEYTESSLLNFFKKYHFCKNLSNGKIYEEIRSNQVIEIYPKIGFLNSNFKADFGGVNWNSENKVKIRFAIAFERNLSKSEKKWALLLEPSYQYFKSTLNEKYDRVLKINYKALDISFGPKKYFTLSDDLKMFANVLIAVSLDLGSNDFIYYPSPTSKIKVEPAGKLLYPTLGFGFLYKKKYIVEMRYDFNRNLIEEYPEDYYLTKYKTLSINFGYKVL